MPDGVYEHFSRGIGERGRQLRREWNEKFADYCRRYPELGNRLQAMQSRASRREWDADLPAFPADAKGLATRESSGKVLNAIARALSVADRRRGRSRRLDQDAAEI